MENNKGTVLLNSDELEKLYCVDGLTLRQIGELYNCEPANVSYWLKKHKIRKTILKSEDSLKQWIYDNCFTQNGKLNNRICSGSWWKKNQNRQDKHQEILSAVSNLNISNIQQCIYHILNNIEMGMCKSCGKPTSFEQFCTGYRQYCSQYCVTQSTERNAKISQNNDYEAIATKVKQHNLKKYGVEYFFQTEEYKEKSRTTKLEKYGDVNYSNLEKNQETCLERYGVRSLFSDLNHQKLMQAKKIQKYGTTVHSPFFVSKAETDILSYLNGLGFNFENNRSVLGCFELDGYDDSIRTAIEYCGLYWHSEQYKNNDYHFKKLQSCREKNIRLITIFEDEWIHRQKQVRQYLSATLGVFSKRTYARECKFVEVKDLGFFEDNHIQGAPNTIDFGFGLLYKDDVIGMISYSRHHRNTDIMTLNRLSFKSDIQCVGGASKLIKNSLVVLDREVITWSDNRWTEGELYRKVGFSLDEELRPDYSYVMVNQKRKSKQSSQKKILNIPSNMTEHQWHLNNKIYRIYDCGKKRWRFNGTNFNFGRQTKTS